MRRSGCERSGRDSPRTSARASRASRASGTLSRRGRLHPYPPAPAPLVIHWFADNTTAAYELAVAQHKPLVLATGTMTEAYFTRLQKEILSSPELAQLAPYAIFAYADPSHDLVAKNIGEGTPLRQVAQHLPPRTKSRSAGRGSANRRCVRCANRVHISVDAHAQSRLAADQTARRDRHGCRRANRLPLMTRSAPAPRACSE